MATNGEKNTKYKEDVFSSSMATNGEKNTKYKEDVFSSSMATNGEKNTESFIYSSPFFRAICIGQNFPRQILRRYFL